jgi:hypothetical protein
MMRFGADSFDDLAAEVAFCLENIRHPDCTIEFAGRFYEIAAEHLRAHAILRLLIDADISGFSNDLVMSGQSRRAWLSRCQRRQYVDYFCALSRSGSMFDAVAAGDVALANEIFAFSPVDYRKGDEYEDEFCYQRFLGLYLSAASVSERSALLARYATVVEEDDPRLLICQSIERRDADAFTDAFQELLRARSREIVEDRARADEELVVAIETKVFIEGIAVLKCARGVGLSIAAQYPMCPAMALLPHTPTEPDDEFALPQ